MLKRKNNDDILSRQEKTRGVRFILYFYRFFPFFLYLLSFSILHCFSLILCSWKYLYACFAEGRAFSSQCVKIILDRIFVLEECAFSFPVEGKIFLERIFVLEECALRPIWVILFLTMDIGIYFFLDRFYPILRDRFTRKRAKLWLVADPVACEFDGLFMLLLCIDSAHNWI